MDRLTTESQAVQHMGLANGRWGELPLNLQLGNIGSEVSRALKWQTRHNEKLMNGAIDRALELFDFSIKTNVYNAARLREICRAREEFCDYFFGGNSFHTQPEVMQRYYDQFVTLGR